MPGRVQERAYSEAHLAGGVLMFSITQRGKRTLQEGGATTFIPLEYDVCGDITLHAPSTGNSG